MRSLTRDRRQVTATAEGAQWGKMAEFPLNRLFWRKAASLEAFCLGFGTERRSEREQLGRFGVTNFIQSGRYFHRSKMEKPRIAWICGFSAILKDRHFPDDAC